MNRKCRRHHGWTAALAALLCATFSASAGATAIVAVQTSEAIGIAADSLLTIKGGEQSSTPQLECKIFETADVVFTLAGFVADPSRSFDLRNIIRAALTNKEPQSAAGDAVAARTAAALEEEIGRLRRESPDLYRQALANRSAPLVKVLLATYDDESPRLSLFIFSRVNGDEPDKVTVSRKSCPGDCSPGAVNAVFLADTGPIEKALRAGTLSWEKPEQGAKALVEKVIQAGTPGVGPPVDQVRIDRNGITWIARKSLCSPIEDHSPPVGNEPVDGTEEGALPLRTK